MTPGGRRRLSRELSASDQVPYLTHVDPHVLRTRLRDYVQVFRLGGMGFETADDVQLNAWHERLNFLWRNLAGPHLALWMHVVRRRESLSWQEPPRSGFSAALRKRYQLRLSEQVLMINELFLSVVYRPAAGAAAAPLARFLGRAAAAAEMAETAGAIEICSRFAQTMQTALARYQPERLGVYSHNGRLHSAALEFLAFLINGEWQRMPLPNCSLPHALVTSRLLFGREVVEYRQPVRTRVGAMLGIKEYPSLTSVGTFDRLLSAPFDFVLTQSFAFLSKAAAQGLLQRQIHRLANVGDFALSQAQELHRALDALTANEFAFGEHHFSLQVMADVPATTDPAPEGRLHALHEALASARTVLTDTGMTVAREDLALEAAFWAQLPGNMPMRPRRAAISSRNFAAMAALHAHPTGRRFGNHWGEAVTTFVTSARSAFHFSLHASDPQDNDGAAQRDTGHTFICGPTGSGKTVFIGFLLAMLEQQGVTQCVFDKDHGLEILIRAVGGEYLTLRNGVATGCNPLQLADEPGHREFLKMWLAALVRAGTAGAISVQQQLDLDQALRGTLELPRELRRLSRLIEFLDPTDPEGVHARLSRWCESTRGDYAWVFDNPMDRILVRMTENRTIGFDVTDFLDHELVRGPLTLYLFHLVRQLLDGRRLVCWMDEFWRLLEDRAFESFAKDGPKTWRKLNGVMCLATQSPSDVLRSAISRTIIEQTPTKIFFPNLDAVDEEYMGGFGLSEREFALVRGLHGASRRFLIKQGHHSVVCELDLHGFDAELEIISARRAQIERMRELIVGRGSDPSDWLPGFLSGLASVPDSNDCTEDPQCS
jgi:type IV secretion system protein VirB4